MRYPIMILLKNWPESQATLNFNFRGFHTKKKPLYKAHLSVKAALNLLFPLGDTVLTVQYNKFWLKLNSFKNNKYQFTQTVFLM